MRQQESMSGSSMCLASTSRASRRSERQRVIVSAAVGHSLLLQDTDTPHHVICLLAGKRSQSWLQNVGLLLVCMVDADTGEDIVQISCVVQVAKRGDEYVRTIMSPLD